MNSFKIFLAAVVIMLASNLLSGCSNRTEDDTAFQTYSNLGMARIDAARDIEKSVQLAIEPLSDTGLDFNLVLKNPAEKPLTSAEVWLNYDPQLLSGVSFKPNDSVFELMAPYENGFDQDLGLLKIGRSTARPTSDASIVLAEVHFERLAEGTAFVDLYDYHPEFSGHASVNMMMNDQPVNLLFNSVSPLLVLR